MICIVALVVFSVMAIFSASYRPLAAEAFDCVFRKVTFRKCRTGLDQRVKADITGKLMKHNKTIARVVYKYFEVFSWALVIITIVSLFFSLQGGYYFVVYGNCNGPTSDGFCIFDPSGSASEFSLVETGEFEECSEEEKTEEQKKETELKRPKSLENLKSYGNLDSQVSFVMFGCYSCENTRKVQEDIFEIYDEYKDRVKFTFVELPIISHKNAILSAKVANCVYEQDEEAYLEVSKDLYKMDLSEDERVINAGKKYVEDEENYLSCLDSNSTIEYIENEIKLGGESNIYGTPTVFVNEQALVGPRPKRVFKIALWKELW